jgi:hypothetical protein
LNLIEDLRLLYPILWKWFKLLMVWSKFGAHILQFYVIASKGLDILVVSQHCSREANGVAYKLTRVTFDSQSLLFWYCDPSIFLILFVLNDLFLVEINKARRMAFHEKSWPSLLLSVTLNPRQQRSNQRHDMQPPRGDGQVVHMGRRRLLRNEADRELLVRSTTPPVSYVLVMFLERRIPLLFLEHYSHVILLLTFSS